MTICISIETLLKKVSFYYWVGYLSALCEACASWDCHLYGKVTPQPLSFPTCSDTTPSYTKRQLKNTERGVMCEECILLCMETNCCAFDEYENRIWTNVGPNL